jgi:phosphoglycerol transferase MdoB-like AlkP superfamily enzyme
MVIYGNLAISYGMVAIICFATLLVGGLLAVMHMRHKYAPNLIAALIGAICCFLLLEALPALT